MFKAQDRISVIIPFYNEEDNVLPLVKEVLRYHPNAEIIAVNDGSTDRTEEMIRISGATCVSLSRNMGQGHAIYNGLQRSTADICVTLDGDGQNDPKYINDLLLRLKDHDCASGRRIDRVGGLKRKIPSRLGNGIRRAFIGDDGIQDAGCGLRAFKREHAKLLFPFEGLHRYMLSIFMHSNLKVIEIPIEERKRMSGRSKYSDFKRAFRGIYQLYYVKKALLRQKKEMSETYA